MADTTENKKMPAIPTSDMPEDWRQKGAEQFNVSVSMIEKVVYGKYYRLDIYEYMLGLAEDGKTAREAKQKELSSRVAAL